MSCHSAPGVRGRRSRTMTGHLVVTDDPYIAVAACLSAVHEAWQAGAAGSPCSWAMGITGRSAETEWSPLWCRTGYVDGRYPGVNGTTHGGARTHSSRWGVDAGYRLRRRSDNRLTRPSGTDSNRLAVQPRRRSHCRPGVSPEVVGCSGGTSPLSRASAARRECSTASHWLGALVGVGTSSARARPTPGGH